MCTAVYTRKHQQHHFDFHKRGTSSATACFLFCQRVFRLSPLGKCQLLFYVSCLLALFTSQRIEEEPYSCARSCGCPVPFNWRESTFRSALLWVKSNRVEWLAGVTTGLTAVPTAVAFAILAGVKPSVGLRGTWIIMLVMALFGGELSGTAVWVFSVWCVWRQEIREWVVCGPSAEARQIVVAQLSALSTLSCLLPVCTFSLTIF